jgi:5-methylcytosine-specific restriction endonuclease McrA
VSRVPDVVVDEVYARAAGRCEACGFGLRGYVALHHRLPRSRGGTDVVANLLLVHSSCHNIAPQSIHANPTRSYELGHTLRTGADPAAVPWSTSPAIWVGAA